jgi:cytochrome c biogenesis protein CcmG/thiol:disulfide interchange protein DsbE
MKKLLIIISLALILFGAACKDKKLDQRQPGPLASGEPAPYFEIRTLDGREINLDSLLGKVILVNFWATWCPPCRAEIPDFIEAYSELKDKGLEILGFSVDDLPESELQNFVIRAGINYPVSLVGREIVAAFKPGQYIPTSIFIDKKGNIRHKHVGKLDKKDLVRIFEELNREHD